MPEFVTFTIGNKAADDLIEGNDQKIQDAFIVVRSGKRTTTYSGTREDAIDRMEQAETLAYCMQGQPETEPQRRAFERAAAAIRKSLTDESEA